MYYFSFYRSVLNRYDVGAVVTGHRVYNRFATLCRQAVKRGIPVYGRKQQSFPFITIVRDDNIAGLYSHEYFFEQHELDEAKKIVTAEILEESKFCVRNGYRGGKVVHQAHNEQLRTISREDLCAELGMAPDKPIVTIFSHCLSDAPHSCGGQLYDDYAEWLKATLKEAIKNKSVNWVVKAHPLRGDYTYTVTTKNIFDEMCGNEPHMFFSPYDLHIRTFYDHCDLVVTCAGSAGLEFPCLGKPAIVASEGFYGKKGFTYDSQTAQEYEEKLRQVGRYFEFTDEMQNNALAYWYLAFKLGRIECRLLPSVHTSSMTPEEEIKTWMLASQKLKATEPSDDPMFEAFTEQIQSNRRHMISRDVRKRGDESEAA